MEATYPIELTLLEGLYLSDSLSMFSQGPPDVLSEQASPYPNLLLKIGSAVLELDQQETPVSVCLGLNELWMIREVAKSSAVIGGERVGINLLLKVYRGIRNLTAGSDVDSAVSSFGEVAEDEPGKDEYTAELSKIRDGESCEERDGEDDKEHESNDADKDDPDHDAKAAA